MVVTLTKTCLLCGCGKEAPISSKYFPYLQNGPATMGLNEGAAVKAKSVCQESSVPHG